MNTLSAFFLWLGLATFFAGVTYAISLFANEPHSNNRSTIHWIHWVLLPFVVLFWVLSTLFILAFRSDKYAKISYNSWLIIKRMCADWC
jgi:hypothetical protein